jgi:glycosyltransferase involved in cell wall biosynthesis
MSSLVSVIISTYNSSSFVIETLDSVSKQTWKELELIITDDCSQDVTVEICRKWSDKNGQRFVHIEIITSDKNSGVPANANRGLHAAKGNWIKFLGADDALEPRCIEDNMAWITLNPEVKVLFSSIKIFMDTFIPQNLLEVTPIIPYDPKGILAPTRSALSQYKMLLLSDRIHFTPSVFLNREMLLSIGGFDEEFRMFEDYPLWLNLTRNGYKLYLMEKVTVNYRRHSRAINNTDSNYLIKPNYFRSEEFRKVNTYPFMPTEIRLCQRFNWYAVQIFRINCLNRNNKLNKIIMNLLTVYLNPFRYYIYLKRQLVTNLKDKEFYME